MTSVKRLQRELVKLNSTPLAPGIKLISADDFQNWLIDIQVMDDNPIYTGKTFRMQFTFSSSYPIEAPEVIFLHTPAHPIPMHPHIYSNGIICLDLLSSQGWSPVHNVESTALSIQSMLTGNDKNERPPGDDDFVRTNRKRPRDVNFVFHDKHV